jgi:ethanolamine utilization protein EutQ (cupin superfamily)
VKPRDKSDRNTEAAEESTGSRWLGRAKRFSSMAQIIQRPTRIQAPGQPPKTIEEFIGLVNSQTTAVSIARMVSPSGWGEPGQTPDFDEFTVVLRGQLQVETQDGVHLVEAGQAVITRRGEWVRYSTPSGDGAEYVAVCLPAFSPQTVHRDSL